MPERLRARRSTWLWPALLVALPWTWFPLRDPLGAAGDVLSILLPVLVVAGAVAEAVVAVCRRRLRLLPAIVSLLAMGVVAVAGPWTAQDGGQVAAAGAVRIAAANVTGAEGDPAALLADPADITVISENARPLDERLARIYPYRAHDSARIDSGVAVYSRYPLEIVRTEGADLPGLEVWVAAPVPFTLYALHVPRPWLSGRGYQVLPAEHHRLVAAVAASAAARPGPVVLAGDLNTTDRSRGYRVLAATMTDAMRAERAAPTSVTTWELLLLRIDHLLVGPGWCGDDPRRLPLPGSDHVAIEATVGPCAG